MVNLSKLFEEQRKLDERIIKEHGLEEMDRLPYLILALQVELGECANEWRGFKYWSKDQRARTEGPLSCKTCYGRGFEVYNVEKRSGTRVCRNCNGSGVFGKRNPLLEEYVDCLHFILSIGLILGFEIENENPMEVSSGEVLDQFSVVFGQIELLKKFKDEFKYKGLWCLFIGLGELLGFTWEQIEQAYMDKNEINHKRQMEGY